MLAKWPIRVKLLVGLSLLVLVVVILAGSGLYGTYAYRALVKSLGWRVSELPVAVELSRNAGDLRMTISELRGRRAGSFPAVDGDDVPLRMRMLRDQFHDQLAEVEETLSRYRRRLEQKLLSGSPKADNQHERETLRKIEAALVRVRGANRDEAWMLDDVTVGELDTELENLRVLAAALPSHLHRELGGFRDEVRGQYRVLIIGTWITSISAALLFALFVRLAWQWVLHPLRLLIRGSRRVAAGEFDYRIHLDTGDEMAKLAEALNDMTARFQHIRDDLDRQVQERTRQVVRSEQLASVGFLAAGVAHEINNPLASIAMCAESLEGRMLEILEASTGADAEQHAVVGSYLRMIQDEAFRCKQITEKLLDFSRIGEVRRQNAELGELVRGVVDMVGHLGKYEHRHIELLPPEPVVAPVNAQEIKQVVLNLLTNALDSLEDGGTVRIELRARGAFAELIFTDDGCGMEPDVLKHVFEPFFTRRRGGRGTGLGLSITYRIVADHGGDIQAHSAGAGCGAIFRVRLPLTETQKEIENQYQAA
ncbi:MAG: HAMP domain-containing protein [Pirellulales bacterium]|nr:HAMP domain-containing protein [Pirellulales bacterium]